MSVINHYQTIPELGFKGRMNTPEEFDRIGLPKDMKDLWVLDIGCNAGAFMLECMERGAFNAHGIEKNKEWQVIANGIFKTLYPLDDEPTVFDSLDFVSNCTYDLILLLSVLHVTVDESPQELLDSAVGRLNDRGLLIIEINDRLQERKIKLPKGAKLYGKNKDNRSVYHFTKGNK